MSDFKQLKETLPQIGRVEWIGLRPAPREELSIVENVTADINQGLVGDRFDGGAERKRQVTFIQREHIDAVEKIMDMDCIDPGLLRRNIVVSGINLYSLKERNFKVGDAIFYGTGNCPPCSRMEENLGAGGYNAMRGHGGITAYVVESGAIQVGDQVSGLSTQSNIEDAERVGESIDG